MSYYDTIDEDLKRAREILERGKADPDDYEGLGTELDPVVRQKMIESRSTIYGADIYAAYKLIESFVKEIEDYAASFNLYHKASMALMHAYRQAHPEVPIHVWPDAAVVNEWAVQEIERLREDRDFWDRKAGEEHAKVIELERQADVLRTLIPLPDTMVPEGELVEVQNALGEALARIDQLEAAMNPQDVPPRP